MQDVRALKRNIPLMYVLTVIRNSLFWAPIWVLFYLRYTNYAGIGLIETIAYLSLFLFEIPTGAIADLLGKKRTLTLAFFFVALGNLIMGIAPSFHYLLLSVFIISIGGALSSGTVEALIYDTLLSIKEEKRFEKILGNTSTIKMTTLAIVTVIGGYLYSISPHYPFLAVFFINICGIISTFFLTEPPIDSETFSLKNYLRQTTQGFQELMKSSLIKKQSLIIISLTMFTAMNGFAFIDIQLAAEGWSGKELGILTALMFLLSAVASQATPWVAQHVGRLRGTIIAAGLIGVTMMIVPFAGMIVGTIFIISRNGILEIFGNSANAVVNSTTQSKYRTTTLSTYNMLSSLPYVLSAYCIGSIMDIWSAHGLVLFLGGILLVLSFLHLAWSKNIPQSSLIHSG